jgi:hypothetical protein
MIYSKDKKLFLCEWKWIDQKESSTIMLWLTPQGADKQIKQ